MADPFSNLSIFGQATSQPTPVNPSLMATMGPQFQQMYGMLPNAGNSSLYSGWNGAPPLLGQYANVNNPHTQPTTSALAALPPGQPGSIAQPQAPYSNIGQLQSAFPTAVPANSQQQNLMAFLQALGFSGAGGEGLGAAQSLGGGTGQNGQNGQNGLGAIGSGTNPGSTNSNTNSAYGPNANLDQGQQSYGIGPLGQNAISLGATLAGAPFGVGTATSSLANASLGAMQANQDLSSVNANTRLGVSDVLSAALNNATNPFGIFGSNGWLGTSIDQAQAMAALTSANQQQAATPVTSAIDLGINAGGSSSGAGGGLGSGLGGGLGGGIGAGGVGGVGGGAVGSGGVGGGNVGAAGEGAV